MRLSVIFVFIMIGLQGFAQSSWSEIDKNSETKPINLKTADEIAGYLTRNLTTDAEKARAIYYWITHNIRFSIMMEQSERTYQTTQEIIDEVLLYKKGVCQHFAVLFQAMASSVGLNVYIVVGYTRQPNGRISDTNHAWNAIRVGQEYFLIDATWASGYERDGKFVRDFRDYYFMIRPSDFITTHMPFDPIWQFLDNPLSHSEFIHQKFKKAKKEGTYPFRKLIAEYDALSQIEQLRVSNERIVNSGLENGFIIEMVENNKHQISSLLYNQANDTLAFAVQTFNTYIASKNSHFTGDGLSDVKIQELIETVVNAVNAGKEILHSVNATQLDLLEAVLNIQRQLPDLESAVAKEKAFVDEYLAKPASLRPMMFQ